MAAVGRPPIGKLRHVRVSDADWDALKATAADQDSDASSVMRELIAWYLRRGPQPARPARPDAHQAAELGQAAAG